MVLIEANKLGDLFIEFTRNKRQASCHMVEIFICSTIGNNRHLTH